MNLLSSFLLPFFLFIFTAESASPVYYFCDGNMNTEGASMYYFLSKLVSGTSQNGFTTISFLTEEGQLLGLAQCRGDISRNDCSSCIQDAATNIRKLCPNKADAKIWYDYCFLRYKNDNFFGEVDTSGAYLYNVQNARDPFVFNTKLIDLMDDISTDAVEPESNGLGKGKTYVSSFLRLYALVQCTRDLSELGCAQCLAAAFGNFPNFCKNKVGCRVLYSSCYVRYEVYPFFFPLARKSLEHNSLDNYKLIVAPKP